MDNLNAKILIVDDEPANSLLFRKVLETQGYSNIMTTSSPCDVVLLHKENNFSLVLLDINMPELSGYEVLELLSKLENFNTTKVIATSGDISSDDINRALDAGFDNYITKPMNMQAMLDIVNESMAS